MGTLGANGDVHPGMATADHDARIERVAVWMAVLGSFLAPFMISGVNVALPTIGREFALDATSLNWVATIYLLTSSVFLLPMGRLADLTGRRRVYLSGLTVFLLASAALGGCSSFGVLIVLRGVQGIGSSMVFSTAAAILTSVVPGPRRGQALGWTVASVYAGLSLGPVLGGYLTAAWGWRSLFLAPLPLGVAVGWLGWRHLDREWADARGEGFDVVGVLLWGTILPLGMFGVSRLPGAAALPWLVGAGICGVLFVAWERRTASPMLRVQLLLENRVFAYSNLAAMINYAATYAVGFLLSLYLQNLRGFDPRGAGKILLAQPLVQALFSPLAGRLSDRFEARHLASAGMACTAVGLAALSQLTADTPLSIVIVLLGFMGFGFALFSSPNINCVMGSVAPKEFGLASGILSTNRILGQMLSMSIAMIVFNLWSVETRTATTDPLPFLGASHQVMGVSAALCVLGILASLARGNQVRKQK